jgi:hypothetical protein
LWSGKSHSQDHGENKQELVHVEGFGWCLWRYCKLK